MTTRLDDEQQDLADRQEALSRYQAMGLRLLLLENGKWAIIYGQLQVEVMSVLDEGWMRSIAGAERLGWEAARAARPVACVGATEKSVEELGL